jgi:hypothetical protein
MEPVDLNLGALGLNMDKIGGLLPGKHKGFMDELWRISYF